MAQVETDDTTRKIAVMVKEADKEVFDKLCDDRTWPQWRMFQELLTVYLANLGDIEANPTIGDSDYTTTKL